MITDVEKGETAPLKRNHMPRRKYPTENVDHIPADSYIVTKSLHFSAFPASGGHRHPGNTSSKSDHETPK
jgi:hypothetical protein